MTLMDHPKCPINQFDIDVITTISIEDHIVAKMSGLLRPFLNNLFVFVPFFLSYISQYIINYFISHETYCVNCLGLKKQTSLIFVQVTMEKKMSFLFVIQFSSWGTMFGIIFIRDLNIFNQWWSKIFLRDTCNRWCIYFVYTKILIDVLSCNCWYEQSTFVLCKTH